MATFSSGSTVTSPTLVSQIPEVRPGDLITAVLMNTLVGTVNQLQSRVAALEGQTQTPTRRVTITEVVGTTQPIRVGTRITVRGTNFTEPAALNQVTVGGSHVPMEAFIGGDETELTFDVPEVSGLAPGGTVVPVVVTTTANGSATHNITVAPRLILPTGTLKVGYSEAPADAIIAVGKTYIFIYEIRAAATLEAKYVIQPTINGVTGWTVKATPNELTIPGDLGGVTRKVPISVTVGSAAVGTLSITVTSPGNAIPFGEALPVTIQPGKEPPIPDNRVRISLNSPQPRPSDNRLVATRNSELTVTFAVTVNEIGEDYVINPVMREPAGWKRSGPDIKKFPVTTVPTSKIITVGFTPDASAQNSDLVFNVTRGTALNVQTSVGVSIT